MTTAQGSEQTHQGCLGREFAFPGLPKPRHQELRATARLQLSLFRFVFHLSSFLSHCTWGFIVPAAPPAPAHGVGGDFCIVQPQTVPAAMCRGK